ncbi:SAM-dependent methyltransferase [Nocardiopsis suaedae]|uniref:SAM-dependent methyltransferase n=1 Tax=Nocardiopsis suaedae TaxID=3018444 RepID=A0ABT4TLP5_9ACTN|nr:SAM-dependent methyltransferase [Nocardiopsis suaedae]MDA2805310.1 SAM-dependent methyltransferase [Nocardiopsis suaedae]
MRRERPHSPHGRPDPARDGAGAGRPRIDPSVAHYTRVWNHWLGGKDSYACDRAVGDHVAVSHPVVHSGEGGNTEAMEFWNANATPPIKGRSPEQVAALLDGLTVLPPGVVSCSQWRPDVSAGGTGPAWVPQVGAVARED